jgi:hypothetical protein
MTARVETAQQPSPGQDSAWAALWARLLAAQSLLSSSESAQDEDAEEGKK